MEELAGVLFFIVLAGTKILLAPGFMLAAGYSIIKTIIITYIGSLIGSIIFYYFGVAIFGWIDKLLGNDQQKKLTFSRKARAMVQVKIRYGIIGLASLSPIISVPISSLIVAKFFPGKHKVVGVYAIVLIPISIILTLISEPIIQPLISLIKHIFGVE